MEDIFKHILENNRHYKLRSYILQFLKIVNTLSLPNKNLESVIGTHVQTYNYKWLEFGVPR